MSFERKSVVIFSVEGNWSIIDGLIRILKYGLYKLYNQDCCNYHEVI